MAFDTGSSAELSRVSSTDDKSEEPNSLGLCEAREDNERKVNSLP